MRKHSLVAAVAALATIRVPTLAASQVAGQVHDADIAVEGRLITPSIDARGDITISAGIITLDHDGVFASRQYTVRVGAITTITVRSGFSRGKILLECGSGGPVEIRARRKDVKTVGRRLRERLTTEEQPVQPGREADAP